MDKYKIGNKNYYREYERANKERRNKRRRELYYEKCKKQYNTRDEFINDDGFTDDEKAEIMQSILDSLEEQEKEM